MITKLSASFIVSFLTVAAFPLMIGKAKIDIKNTVSKGEAVIAVEKIKTQVAHERLISVIEKSIE